MTPQRSCIYCRVGFRSAALTAEPVLPAALGGRLALQRAVCAECAARVRELTDDFLATRFALTAGVMAANRARAGARGAPPASPPADASPDDWRRAHRAAAKILYCYLLLELGQAALSKAPSEMLRRHLMADEHTPWSPCWELTPPRHSPSARWHVLMFDSARSAAAVGLFGTIWFRFPLDLGTLAPHGRLVAFDALEGRRGLAVLRSKTGWRYRSAVKWGWQV
jgi:hypothetical protein